MFIGGILAIVIYNVLAIPLLVLGLAYMNLFFTITPEGYAKIIMRGGKFYRVIFSFKEHSILDETWKVDFFNRWRNHRMNELRKENGWETNEEYLFLKNPAKKWTIVPYSWEEDGLIDQETGKNWGRPTWHKLFSWTGIHWVGIPPFWRIHAYTPSCGFLRPQHDLMTKRRTDLFPINDNSYIGVLYKAETAEKLPVDIDMVIIKKIVNPYLAAFAIGNWQQGSSELIDGEGRDYVGRRSYDELVSREGDGIREHIDSLCSQLWSKYGLQIQQTKIKDINLSSSQREKFREATTAVYVANQHAQATEITGKASANVINMTGSAENEVLKQKMATYAEDREAGQAILNADVGKALGTGPSNTVVVSPDIMRQAGDALSRTGERFGQGEKEDNKK